MNSDGYLYDKVYCRMSSGHDVRLSEIDFNAFESEDIDSFRDLYSDVLRETITQPWYYVYITGNYTCLQGCGLCLGVSFLE